MKKYIKYIVLLIFAFAYLVIGHKYHLYIKCPIHEITNLYCPGCGITRMLYAIITLDFYQAFRFNPLLFLFSPFIIFLIINRITTKKTPIYKKIDNKYIYILIIILIIYGILRNIIPYLKPTVV